MTLKLGSYIFLYPRFFLSTSVMYDRRSMQPSSYDRSRSFVVDIVPDIFIASRASYASPRYQSVLIESYKHAFMLIGFIQHSSIDDFIDDRFADFPALKIIDCLILSRSYFFLFFNAVRFFVFIHISFNSLLRLLSAFFLFP